MTPPPDGTNKIDDDPLGGMDPMAWLESLAKRQGANPDELVTQANLDIPVLPADTKVDEPGYTPGYESNTPKQPSAPAPPAAEPPPPAPAAQAAAPAVDPNDPFGGMDPMAWLESLAKRQGANLDELTTSADIDIPVLPPDTKVDEPGYTPGYESASTSKTAPAPEKPAAPKPTEPPSAPPVKAEIAPPPPPTPAAAEPAPDDPLGGIDPMAWLESLAKRQGAPLDELTTSADLDVPVPDVDTSQLDMPGYTDYDPFGASPLSPSARAIESEPATPPAPSTAPSFETIDSTDTLAWLSSLTQSGTTPYDVLSSEPTPAESAADAGLFDFPDSDYADTSSSATDFIGMTPESAMAWLESLAISDESAPPEPPPAAAPPAPVKRAEIEAGGLSNDPTEIQSWLSNQLGGLMDTRERLEDEVAAAPVEVEPATISPLDQSALPDWLREASVDPTLPTSRSTLSDEIAMPQLPDDLPDWLRQPTAVVEESAELSLEADLMEDTLMQEVLPEARISLTADEIMRLTHPSSEEEVDDWAEALDEEREVYARGDEDVIPDWYLAALQRAESFTMPAQPSEALSEITPPEEPMVVTAEPWMSDTPPSQPAPVLSGGDLPDWLQMLSVEAPPPVAPTPPDMPDWLRPTGTLDASVIDQREAEQALSQFEAEEAGAADQVVPEYAAPEPPPVIVTPPPPPTRPVAPPPATPQPTRPAARQPAPVVLQAARQAAQQGTLQPALAQYQVLVDQQDALEDVRNDLKALAAQNPKEPSVLRLLGDTHMRLGDLQSALDVYLNALKDL